MYLNKRMIQLMALAVMMLAKMADAAPLQLSCVDNVRVGGGWSTDLYMQDFTWGSYYSLFKYDLSALPTNAVITSAKAYTYMDWGGNWFSSAWEYQARQILIDWSESNATYPSVSGDSISATALGASATVTGPNQWIVNDISTTLVQAWVAGTTSNYGVSISKATAGGEYIHVVNRADPTYAPYLLVDYTVPEPGAFLAMAAGLAGLSGMRSRRRG
jgi:hypothetical protein